MTVQPTVKRFRAIFPPGTPEPEVGARLVFPASTLFEEWNIEWSGRGSWVPKRLGGALEDRVGIVLRVEDQRHHHHPEPTVHVVAQDEEPFYASLGVLLTIVGPRQLAEPLEVFKFLRFLYGGSLETDAQRLAVAHQAAPWLRAMFPDLARIRWVPEYEDPAMYSAWLDGCGVHYGAGRRVPGCPIRFDLPPALNLSRTIIRGDVNERLWRNGRAN